jgi:hypothetical protein
VVVGIASRQNSMVSNRKGVFIAISASENVLGGYLMQTAEQEFLP